jgi:hypothetical protein
VQSATLHEMTAAASSEAANEAKREDQGLRSEAVPSRPSGTKVMLVLSLYQRLAPSAHIQLLRVEVVRAWAANKFRLWQERREEGPGRSTLHSM